MHGSHGKQASVFIKFNLWALAFKFINVNINLFYRDTCLPSREQYHRKNVIIAS